MTEEERAPFDDAREALRFALTHRGATAPSVLARLVATAKKAPRRASKRARAAFVRSIRGMAPDLQEVAILIWSRAHAEGSRRSPSGPAPRVPLHGLEAAHMAGLVLMHFARLDGPHQTVLVASTLDAYEECSCGSPCCSGRRSNAPWAQAVARLCELLRTEDPVLANGRRAHSTQPDMRLAMVRDHFSTAPRTLADLARVGRVTPETAARHRDWIKEFLDACEREAWMQLAAVFDQAGITGDAG